MVQPIIDLMLVAGTVSCISYKNAVKILLFVVNNNNIKTVQEGMTCS
jgi:hypothetical protein